MNKTEAQQKIRAHLKNRGDEVILVTEQLIRYWWRICNNAIFRGRLQRPRVKALPRRFDYGYCEPGANANLIVVSTGAFTRALFIDTLIHEMVHQWELENSKYWGHGKGFKRWKNRIERYVGVRLDTEASDEDYNITDGQRQLFKRRYQNSKRPRSRKT